MSDFAEIWEFERRCWVDGRSFYKEIITADSVYAFPPPMGIFSGDAFVDQMGEEGSCVSVEFANRHVRDLGDVVVLVYQGTGKSADGSVRKSNCSTMWNKSDDGWKMVAHHQTPLND